MRATPEGSPSWRPGHLHSAHPGMFVSRGNSRYHYYGIRLKPDSPLNQLPEDTQYMAMRQQSTHQRPR